MNKRQRTLVHFDYAGSYVRKGADVVWICREDVHHALLIKKSSGEVTYRLLVEDICKRIGVEEVSTAMKISYIPLLVDPKKPIYISDDDGVLCYLELYEDNAKSVLHVEVANNQSYDKLPRDDVGSQFVASGSEMVSSVRENYRLEYGNMNQSASEPSEHNAIVVHDQERVETDTLFISEATEGAPSVEGDEVANLEWEDGMNVRVGQEFESKGEVQDLVEQAGHLNYFQYTIVKRE